MLTPDSPERPAAQPSSIEAGRTDADLPPFEQYILEAEHTRGLAATGVGALLYLIFWGLDWIVYPQYVVLLLCIRLAAAAIIGAAALTILVARTSYRATLVSTATATSAAGIGIACMVHLTDGVTSPYYVGLMLVGIVPAVLFAWPLTVGVVFVCSWLAAYFVPLLAYERWIDPVTLTTNSFFLVSAAAVALVGIYLRRRLAYREYRAAIHIAESNRQLRELHRHKDEMFQNVSHELRTPLTLIVTPLEQLLETPMEERVHGQLEVMHRHAMRLLNLINDLLDLARVDSTRLNHNPRPTDINELVRSLYRDVCDAAAQYRLEVSLVTSTAPAIYLVDEQHLEKILLNLVSNALKFTPEGGSIEIGVHEEVEGLTLWVKDTGVGVPRELQERIFERFAQADSGSTRSHGGTGIGLALVAELAELMHAKVTVDSAPGAGSRFSFTIPSSLKADGPAVPSLARVTTPSLGMARAAAYSVLTLAKQPPAGMVTAGEAGPMVVVAEDDPDLNEQLVSMLKRDYRVRAVFDGQAALELCLRCVPHVLISDVMMPKLDGVSLCTELRQRPTLKDTATILLSARGSLDDRIRGRQAGVDSYLTKPFHPKELLATVDGLLRARMKLVGAYIVGDEIGAGAQSRVVRARHRRTGELVALKILSPKGPNSARAKQQLRAEQAALQRVNHPHVVRTVDHGDAEGAYYVAMQYIHGRSLKDYLTRHGKISPSGAREILLGIIDGLIAIHDAGLIHRDIKLSNVMLAAEGESLRSRVRLIDFGVVWDARSTERTKILGTPSFMAPELLSGEGPSVATDIYAVGIVAYNLCSGCLPYRGGSVAELRRIIGQMPAPAVGDFAPGFPPAFEEWIQTAIDMDPLQRPATAQILRDSLESLDLEPPPSA